MADMAQVFTLVGVGAWGWGWGQDYVDVGCEAWGWWQTRCRSTHA